MVSCTPRAGLYPRERPGTHFTGGWYSSMTAALEGGEWSAALPGHTLPPGKHPVPILQEAGWARGPVWMGRKSRPHRDSIPDRPARSQSLYRLSYPVYAWLNGLKKNTRKPSQDCRSAVRGSVRDTRTTKQGWQLLDSKVQ